jgi:hypothetical protein
VSEYLTRHHADTEGDRRTREALYAPGWRQWLDEDWLENLDGAVIRESVRANAVKNLLPRLRGAILSPAGQFSRLADLWIVRKNLDSPAGKRDQLMRKGMTTLYLAWLVEIESSIKDPSNVLSVGADEFWGLIVEASVRAATDLPEMVRTGRFPFQRTVPPPVPLARKMARVMGDILIDSMRGLGFVERWWQEYGDQIAYDPLDSGDDDMGRRLVNHHWLDPEPTSRPTEELALGPAEEADSLLLRHPYLQEWVEGDSVESIAEKYSQNAATPIAPAQMFAKILRVTNAHSLDNLRRPLDEVSSRQWLAEYLAQVLAIRPFRAGGWLPDELVELATAVLGLARTPVETDWPVIVQHLSNQRKVPATKRRWHRLLRQRLGVALLVPWETWPRWIGPMTAALPSGLHHLEQSDPEMGRHVRSAIQQLGGPERAAIALTARYDPREPSTLEDIAHTLSEDGLGIEAPAVAPCIEAVCLIPLRGAGGFETLGDLLKSLQARQ